MCFKSLAAEHLGHGFPAEVAVGSGLLTMISECFASGIMWAPRFESANSSNKLIQEDQTMMKSITAFFNHARSKIRRWKAKFQLEQPWGAAMLCRSLPAAAPHSRSPGTLVPEGPGTRRWHRDGSRTQSLMCWTMFSHVFVLGRCSPTVWRFQNSLHGANMVH